MPHQATGPQVHEDDNHHEYPHHGQYPGIERGAFIVMRGGAAPCLHGNEHLLDPHAQRYTRAEPTRTALAVGGIITRLLLFNIRAYFNRLIQ